MPHRRHLLALVPLGAVGLMSAPTTGATRTDIDNGVAGLMARWDAISPVAVLADTQYWAYLCRTLGGDRANHGWKATTAAVALLAARAHADLGETGHALTQAQKARLVARSVGDTHTEAWAELVAAETHDAARPNSEVPLQRARTARQIAGTSWVGIHAAAVEAALLARLGSAAAPEVRAVLVDATIAAGRLPEPAPGQFTAAQLHAFGGCALTRAGQHAEAARWLADAEFDPTRQTGMASAVLSYRASAAVAGRRFDEGAALAGQALDVSKDRPVAWLASGIRSQAARAGGAGGYSAVLGRLGGWPEA